MIEKKYNSLQDSLMEFIVMHFRKVFLDSGVLRETRNSGKKLLPPCLFERIAWKSKTMNWYIHLEDILQFRDVLSWKNINAKSTTGVKDALVFMDKVIYPLKSLSLHLMYAPSYQLSCICNMGSVLESLSLTYGRSAATKFLDGPFPKLKRLQLSSNDLRATHVICLDLSKFTNTLEEIKLYNICLDESSMKSLATVKQLKVLSFRRVNNICHDEHFLEALSSLDQLRTLCLTDSISDMPDKYRRQFITVISKLPSLENCDISLNDEIKKDLVLDIMKCRKWKKFGIYDCCDNEDNYFSYDNFKPFADQVFAMYDETILYTLSAYIHDLDEFSPMVRRIIDIIDTVSEHQIPMIENVLLSAHENEEHGCVDGEVLRYIDTGRFTNKFAKQLINAMCSMYEKKVTNAEKILYSFYKSMPYYLTNERVARTMLEIVQKNVNKGFTRILLKSLFIFSRYGFDAEIQELGIDAICREASANKTPHYESEELILAMGKLLSRIVKKFEE